ncbi:hypothetical protein LTSEHVI_4246 [Salmonella enterica subsp. enterica serovar Hvittingfoss str. A4-620]|nr:hypothetical protein LTSEHVI_4246 [Salmonella enterica subsp. enterica serovar Hvittingfoss str. A4-620]
MAGGYCSFIVASRLISSVADETNGVVSAFSEPPAMPISFNSESSAVPGYDR